MRGRAAVQCGVLFALVFPTIITWVYFVALRQQPAIIQQSAYAAGKAIQFGFPLVWLAVWRKRSWRWRLPDKEGWTWGLAFGAAVAGAILALYFLALKPAGFFHGPGEEVRRKIMGIGMDHVGKYALVGVFYALVHSLLEEYYWRWFVFRQLQLLTRLPGAVIISSLGFMAHHVLVLATYFGWQSPATWLFSAAIAVGGAAWAGLYQRTQSLVVPWIGHCLVDAAIFLVGYDLAREVFQAGSPIIGV